MDTPICDFVREYMKSEHLRLHMPGHKGAALLGMEPLDITEINGADSLYEAEGIIARSEANASTLFGCKTLFSTEGSSQCIRAMLYLVALYAKRHGRKPIIAAGRNAHKAFMTATALLDLDIQWLYPREIGSYLSCKLTADDLDQYLSQTDKKPAAVYLTSPDYLGNLTDISAAAQICHKYDVLLAVDNAHGSYLKFLSPSQHPIDLGADICCDSAHKTLPALTGAAYLHLSEKMDQAVGAQAKNAMMLFGSTSPSYLILQSLDAVNLYLENYTQKLDAFISRVQMLKDNLARHSYCLCGDEATKVTIAAKAYGYTGHAIAQYVRQHNIEPEFADHDYLVLMLTPELTEENLLRLEQVLLQLPPKEAIEAPPPNPVPADQILTIREAIMSDFETLPANKCIGRILAIPSIGCPPAVPILVCGERITQHAVSCLSYYGIDKCCVVKE